MEAKILYLIYIIVNIKYYIIFINGSFFTLTDPPGTVIFNFNYGIHGSGSGKKERY